MATLPINPKGGAPTGMGGVAQPLMPMPAAGAPTNLVPGGATTAGSTTTGILGATNTALPTNVAMSVPASTGTSISSGLSTVDGSNTVVGDFSDTYGKGVGTALADTLANLGTATDGAVSATNTAIEADAAKSRANISSGEAASGISADSSTAALAQGDFASSLANTIASTDSGMELSEENTLISTLQGEGAAHGSDSSAWDQISGFLSGGGLSAIGSGANALNETGASGTGGFSSLLSTIGMFA